MSRRWHRFGQETAEWLTAVRPRVLQLVQQISLDHGGSHRAFHSDRTESASSSDSANPRTRRQQMRNVRRSPCCPATAGSTHCRKRERASHAIGRSADAAAPILTRPVSAWSVDASRKICRRPKHGSWPQVLDRDRRRRIALVIRETREVGSFAHTTWPLHRCAAPAPGASGLSRRRQSRILEPARRRERGPATSEGRTTAAASQSGSSTPPAVPARRCPPRETHDERRRWPPASASAQADGVDADIDVPAAGVPIAEPALKAWTRGIRHGHDALGRLAGSIGLEKHRDPVGRLVRRPQEPKRRLSIDQHHGVLSSWSASHVPVKGTGQSTPEKSASMRSSRRCRS